jgi:hypothetical protein
MTQASGRFTRKFLRYDVTPEDKIKEIEAELSSLQEVDFQ